MVTVAAAWAAAAAFAATDAGQGAPEGATGIVYRTLFQDPAAGSDFSLEQHAIDLINATPDGERITFAFRDFNRDPVADALIAAQGRGVVVDGVIDGGERTRAVVQRLKTALGSDRFVICGEPTFEFNSCIANSPRFKPSLQHNKFLTFSRLSDGRQDVVLQTSENFLSPTQFNYYNDMVEIAGDHALHAAYANYVFDMKAQLRSDDRSQPLAGDGQHNTMFPSPRSQPDWDTNDTIVDRMDEIDCSEGGSESGHGLIRVANMAFRSERAVIMRELIELRNAGCDIDVVASNADGDIVSGLVSAGVPLHLFAKRLGTTPAVLVHDKFWLVDAKSTVTGRRTKITYAGSSNWRGDEQYSDDMLLRIVDDGVYDAYSDYWKLIRSRVVSDPSRSTKDTVAPRSALTVTPAANAAGWNRSESRSGSPPATATTSPRAG